jgi:hypothetical protein
LPPARRSLVADPFAVSLDQLAVEFGDWFV